MSTLGERAGVFLSSIERLGSRVMRAPVWLLAAVAVALAVGKAGPALEPMEGWFVPIDRAAFPAPAPTTYGTSYAVRVIAWLAGTDDAITLAWIAAVASVASFAIVGYAVVSGRSRHGSRLLLIAVITGPAAAVALRGLGRNDAFLLAGSLLVGLAAVRFVRSGWLPLGAVLMALGNPEQAVIGLALLVLVAWLMEGRVPPAILVTLAAVALLAFGLDAWARSLGIVTRSAILAENLVPSLDTFARNLPLVAYSGYLAWWLVVIGACAALGGWARVGIAAALIAVPALATATTLDQTRVWVGVSTAAVAAVAGVAARSCDRLAPRHVAIAAGCVAIAAVVFPVVEVTFRGAPAAPYGWLVPQVASLVAGVP